MAGYAGLDVHKKNCPGAIVDESGEVLEDEEFENSLLGVGEFFRGFEERRFRCGCSKSAGEAEAAHLSRPEEDRFQE